jgi:hypothetical protein
MFIIPTAKQLDTKVCNHIASLLYVSALFGHLQGGIGQRIITFLNMAEKGRNM